MPGVDPLDLVETIRESLLVLEPDLTIRFANRAFCQTFAVAPEHTVGRKLYELGDGQWDIPGLRASLETIISGHKTIEAFEVDHVFPSIGRRVMALNARKVYRHGNNIKQILLAIEDVTDLKPKAGPPVPSSRTRRSPSRSAASGRCCRGLRAGSACGRRRSRT